MLALLAAATLGLLIFVLVELRVHQPMIDLSMFRNVLLSANLLMAFLVFIVLSATFIMPFFLQNVMGYPTQMVGFLMMASPITMGLVSPLAGSLSDKFGSRVISLVGLVVLVLACFWVATLHQNVTPLGIILRLVPLGLGFALFQSPNNSAIMGTARRERMGVTSGLMSLSRTLGTTTGLPLIGSIFTAQVLALGRLPAGSDMSSASTTVLVSALNSTYQIASIFIFASILLALFAWRFDTRARAARAVVRETV